MTLKSPISDIIQIGDITSDKVGFFFCGWCFPPTISQRRNNTRAFPPIKV